MSINKDDIKLMSSQNLTDFDDGGGVMIGTEIVDGNVNNLFPDISRLDRVYGRVSIRKAFVLVNTNNTDTYYGCHVILTDPPDDPLVSTIIYSDNEYASVRRDIQDDIEQYVVRSSRFLANVMDLHVTGSRGLLLFAPESVEPPKVGDVLFLIERADSANEISEYVRVVDLEWSVQEFVDQTGSYKKKIIEIELQNPLKNTYTGRSVQRIDEFESGNRYTAVYKTIVADASNYYGVAKLKENITANDLHCKVDSIFKPIVPSAQTETALVDVNAAGNVSVYKAASAPFNEQHSFNISIALNANAKIYCGIGILPGSLMITHLSYTWTDDFNGNLIRSGEKVGVVNYGNGEIVFLVDQNTSGVIKVAFIPAVPASSINQTASIEITMATRAYTFVKTLRPLPDKNSVIVDYMSQGNWYRLRDNGQGVLVPEIPGTGSGTVNYETGTVSLTCAALPDIDSAILFYWAAPIEYTRVDFTEINPAFACEFALSKKPVQPNTLSFTFQGNTITDDGNGRLQGANGTIDYTNGIIKIYPDLIPIGNSGITGSFTTISGVTYKAPETPPQIDPISPKTTTTGNGVNATLDYSGTTWKGGSWSVVYKLPSGIEGFPEGLEVTVMSNWTYSKYGSDVGYLEIKGIVIPSQSLYNDTVVYVANYINPASRGLPFEIFGSMNFNTRILTLYGTITISKLIIQKRDRGQLCGEFVVDNVQLTLKGYQTI